MKESTFFPKGPVESPWSVKSGFVWVFAIAAFSSLAFAEDSTGVVPSPLNNPEPAATSVSSAAVSAPQNPAPGSSPSGDVPAGTVPDSVASVVSSVPASSPDGGKAAAASVSAAPPASSSSAAGKLETVPVRNVQEVVVSAKKVEKKPEKPQRSVASENALPAAERFSSPASASGVEVYTQEDIEKMQPSDVYGIFERALGLMISRQGSRIHNWVQSRDGGNSNLGIIIDGVYIPATAAQRILGDIPVEMIESIRIVRDASILTMGPLMAPGSTYAGSANQGFIIIETKKTPQDKDHTTQATVGYGTYNSKKLVVFHGEKIGNIGSFGVGYAKKKNDSKVDRDGDWNNAYDGNTYLVNGQLLDIGPISANGLVLYNRAKREIQRYQLADGTFHSAAWTYDPMNTKVFTLGITGKWTKNQITQLSAGYNDVYGMGYYDTMDSTDTKTYVAGKASRDKALEGNLYHTWIFRKASITNSLKFGGQYVNWYQRTEGKTEDDASIEDMYGLYATDQISVTRALSFDAGYRLDKRYIVQGGSKYTEDGKTVKLSDDTWANDGHSVSVGGAFDPAKQLDVTARFSFTNSPTSDQLYTVNDKSLPSEKRLKYEAGVTSELIDALGMTVTGYYYDIHDAKVQATGSNGKSLSIKVWDTSLEDSASIPIYDCESRLARYGMEMSVFGRNIGPFGYQLGLTLARSNDSADNAKIPKYKLSGDLSFASHGFSADLNMLRMPRYASSMNDEYVGNYFVFNVTLAQQIGDHFKASVYGKNVTNEKYTGYYKTYPMVAGYYYEVGALYGVDLSVNF